ncbi:MAG: nucleotidyl transferase AbiEii/AbiGii toxin family protein [Chlamydiota bacterium]
MSLQSLRKRLEAISKEKQLRLDILQQDYLLSWLLVGIFEHPQLKSNLIFKGGTALKKGYFGNYRFSEDLDFSMIKPTPHLFEAVKQACKQAEIQMRELCTYSSFLEKI